jgi:hypothetical protein
MQVELLATSDPKWSKLLGRVRHDFYHTPEYVALCAREDGEACALYAAAGDNQLLLPLVRREVPLRGRTDLSSPYGYPGPLLLARDASFLEDALSAALQFLRDEGVVALFVRLHPLLEVPLAPLEKFGAVVEHGATVCIDLRHGPAATWADMRKSHRYEIRRSEREGLVARRDVEWRSLNEFVALYTATMQRRSAQAHYFFPERYFTDLRDALGERLTLWVATQSERILAASLFTEVSGIVQYHLSASDESIVAGEPTKLIIDAVRKWAHERGDTDLHLGGGVGAADDSLLFFKSGFSSRRCSFRSWRVVVDPATYAELAREFAPSDDVSARQGFFPAYRRT